MPTKKKKKVAVEYACTPLGRMVEPAIREYIRITAEGEGVSVLLTEKGQDAVVEAVVNAIEDTLCS